MLINDIITETTSSGAIAVGAVSGGPMHKRPNPSVFVSKPKSKKTVKEEAEFNPEVHAKFKDNPGNIRSKYIYDWAQKNGIDPHDAMIMAGYQKRFGQNMYDYLPPKEYQ
mgnify:CR=1 FL=1